MLIMRQQQQFFAFTACLCSIVIVIVSAVPLPANNQELDVLQIPLSDGKELDVLTLSARDQEQLIAERNKRTIGLLRELFPDITKEIDGIVNRIIGQVIRVAGPSLLPALLGNNRPTTEASDFDADFEDDDDSSSNDVNPKPVESVFSKTEGNTGTSDDASRVNIGLPTFAPESGEVTPTTTSEPIKKVSSGKVGGEKATTDITTTSTTTAAATMKPTTTTSGTMMPQTTTVIPTTTTTPTTTTSTTSKPIPIPTIPTTTSTTSAASPTTIPTSTTTITIPTSSKKTTTPTPITTTTIPPPITTTTIPPPITTTTAPSTTIPTTTVDSILVLTTNKGPSRGATNRNKNNNTPNVTTQQPTTIENGTKSSFNTTPAISIDLPTYPPTISDILKPTTTETLPTPSIPATYLGTFDSALEEPQLQRPSTRSLTQKEQQQLQQELQQQQSQINSLPFAVDVDRTQLVALIDNINRLLNSTNFFIDNRNNTNSPQFTTTTITNNITTTTTPSIAVPTTRLMPTANITKLLPNGATDTQIDLSAINKQLEETIRVARQVKEAEAAAQQQQQQSESAAPAQIPIPSKTDANAPVQLSFSNEATPLSTAPDNSKPVNNDLRSTDSKSPAIDELTLDSNEDAADLDDRNKRFLSFGGAGVAGGSGGNAAGGNAAAGGGSGNFLFDIIRLFSGSVQTQTGDEAANSANSVSADGDVGGYGDANRAADGFTEGIPGPVTRLVVLANRGLANLIQDLILRIAATSEKFVNFKAKLITALI